MDLENVCYSKIPFMFHLSQCVEEMHITRHQHTKICLFAPSIDQRDDLFCIIWKKVKP